MGGQVTVVVAGALVRLTGGLGLEQDRGQLVHRRLGLGEVDVLPLTGSAPMLEPGHDRGHEEPG